MVDVSEKQVSIREATAVADLLMSSTTAELIQSGNAKKGDVLGVARLAAIQATKITHQLIPLCHAIPVEAVTVTVYDMVKAVERGMEVRSICLLEKKGGKTGDFLRT